MKKTMVFENEFDYDNWFEANEEKEGGHDFLEDRVVIVKGTRTINGKKFNGFSADSTIECKNIRTAVRRFVKELNSNGFEVSVDEFESSCNGENIHDLTGSGMIVEVEEIDDGRYYVNYMCYQDEVEEETTETETEQTEEPKAEEPETSTEPEETKKTDEFKVDKVVFLQKEKRIRVYKDNGIFDFDNFDDMAIELYMACLDALRAGKYEATETKAEPETATETATEEPKEEDTATVTETQTTEEKAKKQRKNINWINESNVQFNIGNYEPCIFKFDNSKVWFNSNAICTTQSIKSMARRMAQHYNAKEITIKYLWNENETTEPRENVVDFLDDYWGEEYKFRIELPVKEGEKRQFRYFEESEIFA